MFQVSVSATQSKQRHFLLDITLNLEIQINDIIFESDHPEDSSSSPTIQEEGGLASESCSPSPHTQQHLCACKHTK